MSKVRAWIGFTVSELLITITIIGIVASLTIPQIVQNVQNIQYKTIWKQDASIIEQAVRRAYLDKQDLACNPSDNCKNLFAPYFKKIQSSSCWHAATNIKELNGNTKPDTAASPWQTGYVYVNNCFTLNNGSLVTIWTVDSVCSTRFMVDVNGFKDPNSIGKDIFAGIVDGCSKGDNTFHPYGSDHQGSAPAYSPYQTPISTTCVEGSTDSANTGWGCSAKYLLQ